METVDRFNKANDEKLRAFQSCERPQVRSEFLLEKKPQVTSVVQKRENERIALRQKEGLTDQWEDQKAAVSDPSLNFIAKPKHASKQELIEARRQQNLKELNGT